MALSWPNKDPNEVLDYSIDWSQRLKDDTITTSSWIVPNTVFIESNTFTTRMTTVWLSGGTVSANAISVTNRIETAGNRVMEQSVLLKIQDK